MRWTGLLTAAALLVLVLAISSKPAGACSCLEESAWESLQRADAGLVGTITAKTPDTENPKIIWYELDVDWWYKRAGDPTVTLRISHDSSDGCSSEGQHRIGERLAVAVMGSDGNYIPNVCSSLSGREADGFIEPPQVTGVAEVISVVGTDDERRAIYFDRSGSRIGSVELPAVRAQWSVCPQGRFATALKPDGTLVVFDATTGTSASRTVDSATLDPIGSQSEPTHATCLDSVADDMLVTACPDGADTGHVPADPECPRGIVYLDDRVYYVGARPSPSEPVPLFAAGQPDDLVDASVGDFGGGFFGSLEANPSRTRFVVFRPDEQGRATLLVSSIDTGEPRPIDVKIDRQPTWVDDETLLIERFGSKALLDVNTGSVRSEIGYWTSEASTLIDNRLWGVADDSVFFFDLDQPSDLQPRPEIAPGGRERLWPVAHLSIDTALINSTVANRPGFARLEPLAPGLESPHGSAPVLVVPPEDAAKSRGTTTPFKLSVAFLVALILAFGGWLARRNVSLRRRVFQNDADQSGRI